MISIDQNAIACILAAIECLDAPSQLHLIGQIATTQSLQSRLDARDNAILQIAKSGQYASLTSGRSKAEALSTALRRLAAIPWAAQSVESDTRPNERNLLLEIIKLNSGKALGHEQIRKILAGTRSYPDS